MERRWRTACKTQNDQCISDDLTSSVSPILPNDSELAAALVERKKRLVEIVMTSSQIYIFRVQNFVRKLFRPHFLIIQRPSCSALVFSVFIGMHVKFNINLSPTVGLLVLLILGYSKYKSLSSLSVLSPRNVISIYHSQLVVLVISGYTIYTSFCRHCMVWSMILFSWVFVITKCDINLPLTVDLLVFLASRYSKYKSFMSKVHGVIYSCFWRRLNVNQIYGNMLLLIVVPENFRKRICSHKW